MDRRYVLTSFVALGATAAASSGIGGVVGNTVGRTTLGDTLEGSLSRRGRGRAVVHWSVDTQRRAMALTFDDGPDPDLTPQVLRVLDRLGVSATFFVLGAMAERHPDILRTVVDSGHEIGNHSYDHHHIADTDADGVIASILRGAETIERITGERPRFYRPPRGHVTGAVMTGAAAAGCEVALWSLGRGGSDIADDDADGVAAHLTTSARPGDIVCLHDGYGDGGMAGKPMARLVGRRQAEILALPSVITRLDHDGWTFHTLSDLVEPTSR
jgi:peptidoglycan/xylan/chitin deacetylase (PgdA/CDA1 family)